MKHAPHHTTCELRWQCRARSCCKCNRARSLPGAAGPVRPAANSHGRALHKKHSTSKLAVELSAAGCCRCLQLAGRHYEPQPNRYESRHHDALPSTSLQRVHAAAVRPKRTPVVGVHARNRSARGWCGKSRCAPYMHVGTALAVRCHARAASATDLRARYLAPLARCALLPTLPRRRCTPPSRRIRSSAAAVSFL